MQIHYTVFFAIYVGSLISWFVKSDEDSCHSIRLWRLSRNNWWVVLTNSLNYLCERVLRDALSRSKNWICFEIAHCSPPAKAELADKLTTGLSKVPDRLEWLVRNQNYALIQCSFSYHKRCHRMIAIRRRKRQAQLKASFLIPSACV